MRYVVKLILCLFLLQGGSLLAQTKHFITSGIIEFEKTNNMFALMKKKLTRDNAGQNRPYYERYLRTEPQFLILKSTLAFGNNTSLYTPTAPDKPIAWFYDQPIVSQLNTVFSDFGTGKSTIQKEVYERTFLVRDTLRKIKWKITDETRVIAGYNCRRANGLVLDSIYAVAFYAEDIHIPGGPESFNGLPGMILGVALPHENITWYATKITEAPADPKKLVVPKKGKVVNNKELKAELWKIYARADEIGFLYVKGFTL
jgi:GLPGLI family protein